MSLISAVILVVGGGAIIGIAVGIARQRRLAQLDPSGTADREADQGSRD